jgi:hypothetical protein
MHKETPYEFYDNKLGIKVKYLVSDKKHKDSLELIPYRTLKKRMDSQTCCEQQLRRASLNMDSLILFSSLSRDFKDNITTKFGLPKQEIKKSWFSQHYEASRDAFNFFVAHRYGENLEKKLDIKLVEQYTYNASVLNTVLQMKTNRKAYAKALGATSIDIWDSLSKDVNAFREVAHNLPANKDGLRRKATEYAKAGYSSIISGRLQNSNARKVTEKEQMALLDELLAKHTNLDNELICTLYNIVAEKMEWKTITSTTVWNRKQKSNLVTHAGRQGTKSLKANVLMQIKRTAPSAPMLYWTLDGWDVELLYQDSFVNKEGKRVTTYHNRLTIVLVVDPFNKYPIGYAIGTNESPELIKRALQNAMQHVKELFGDFYKPYQLQSDNYGRGALTPLYKAITEIYTPAEVGNAKAKIIEPHFNTLNKKYCKLMDNWSGHNIVSGSKNQPNTEYLQKIKHSFPDKVGCISQIEGIVAAERNKKVADFTANWVNVQPRHKTLMSLENYLLTFGSNTGDTNKLKGEGLRITIDHQLYWFDSFDINFRHKSHLDWSLQFDTHDLSHALAISADGTERFVLERKFVQPMALADRMEGDVEQLQRVKDFNKEAIEMIVNERVQNASLLEPLMNDPRLNDTLAKHLLTDSLGQHKNHKSQERLAVAKSTARIAERAETKEIKKVAKTFADEQAAYYSNQINAQDYL